MADDFEERRKAPRVPTRSLVEVKLPSWEALRAVYTTNISMGGMRLSLGAKPPLGAGIDIILTLPSGHRLHLPGRIANLGADGTGDAGVKFDPLPTKIKEEIQFYINEVRAGRDPTAKAASIPSGHLIKKST